MVPGVPVTPRVARPILNLEVTVTRWLLPAFGAAVIALAALVAVFVWSQSGDSASGACDRDALVAAMQEAISQADHDGVDQMSPNMPDGCSPEDMMQAMTEVSRSWHAMPDGTIMRAAEHTP